LLIFFLGGTINTPTKFPLLSSNHIPDKTFRRFDIFKVLLSMKCAGIDDNNNLPLHNHQKRLIRECYKDIFPCGKSKKDLMNVFGWTCEWFFLCLWWKGWVKSFCFRFVKLQNLTEHEQWHKVKSRGNNVQTITTLNLLL